MAQENPVIGDMDDIMEEEEEYDPPIFYDIYRGDFDAVQQRVLADAAVLEERNLLSGGLMTPLMRAIERKKPAIALWLLEDRGQHDVETAAISNLTALHYASEHVPLELVQALLAAGANPARPTECGFTPLTYTSGSGHTDIVACLLRLPAVEAGVDAITQGTGTRYIALSAASYVGHQPVVELLLGADANLTIPAGQASPLVQATSLRPPTQPALTAYHYDIAVLLRRAIAEVDRARALHRARFLLCPGLIPACLEGRVERRTALPQVKPIAQQQQHWWRAQEKLRATTAIAAGCRAGRRTAGCVRICM